MIDKAPAADPSDATVSREAAASSQNSDLPLESATPAGTAPAGEDRQDGERARARRPWYRRDWLADALAIACYCLLAYYVMTRYWQDPAVRTSAGNVADETLFEWMLAHAAWAVTHLDNPLFTDRLGVPDGMSAIGNTSVLALGIPLTPVTLLWGPSVAYAAMVTVNFAATGVAWYFVLSRYVVTSRLAAFIGACFCAFAPGMLSQATGHAHIQAQFLLPLIMWRVFRMRTSSRPIRDGVVLGLLIATQLFISEETLFITAMVCGLCTLAYAVRNRSRLAGQVRPFLTGLGTAACVALVLLAYPLYQQFFGPGNYRDLPWIDMFRADLAAYPAFSQLTIAGGPPLDRDPLSQNMSELNAFFGWPLLILATGIVGWLWREPMARLAGGLAVLFAALSLGTEININGEPSGIPGPWRPFASVPLFDVIVTTRFAMVTACAIGVLLALAVDRAMRSTKPTLLSLPLPAWATLTLVVLALLPLVPRPLPVIDSPPAPEFFSSGAYLRYTGDDGAVMVLPPRPGQAVTAMGWAAEEKLRFRLVDGRFLGPLPGSPDRVGTLNRPITPTGELLIQAVRRHKAPKITAADRERARQELRENQVAIMVLPAAPTAANEAVRATAEALVGPAQRITDMWVWDVRSLS